MYDEIEYGLYNTFNAANAESASEGTWNLKPETCISGQPVL